MPIGDDVLDLGVVLASHVHRWAPTQARFATSEDNVSDSPESVKLRRGIHDLREAPVDKRLGSC